MSKIPEDKLPMSPWGWTDKTINDLMTELSTVREIVRNTPNDQQLGSKIRAWAHKTKGDYHAEPKSQGKETS